MRQRRVMAVACAVSAVALVAGVAACSVESTSSTTTTVSSSSVPAPVPTGPETSELSQIASVVRIVPMSGPAGSHVTITGTDFAYARAVCFGAFPSPRFQVRASGSQITAVVPAGSGTVQVTVVKNVGISAVHVSGDTFTFSGSAVAGGVASTASPGPPCTAASPEPSP
jgi:hypothetical protein